MILCCFYEWFVAEKKALHSFLLTRRHTFGTVYQAQEHWPFTQIDYAISYNKTSNFGTKSIRNEQITRHENKTLKNTILESH